MRRLVLSLLFFLAGVGMIGYGIYNIFFYNRGMTESTAVIDHIERTMTGYDEDGSAEYDYEVLVSYTVDGKQYQSELGYHEDGFKEGQEIKIYYDPSDPEKLHADTKKMGICLVISGPALWLAALGTLLKAR